MKIILNDASEKVVDKLKDAFITMVSIHTYIWDGTASDTYKYEIEVEEEPVIIGDRDYTLEEVSVLYKNGFYLFEIMNAKQLSTVDIKKNEVENIVIM